MRRRVVITGMGVVSPIGIGLRRFWESLKAGTSGVGLITRFDRDSCPVKIAAEIRDFDPGELIDCKTRRRMDRFSQYAVVAAAEALRDAGISPCDEGGQAPAERMGVAIGSGVGGIETIEEQHSRFLQKGPAWVSPFYIPMMISNMAAGNVAIMFNAKGPSTCSVTACASGAHSIGDAMRLVRGGEADVMIAGGSEAAITPFSLAGFASMQALSASEHPGDAPRPFDLRRDGFVMGEGAGILILEELSHAVARGAHIYAEMAGFGSSTDAYHITSPSPGGEGAARAMLEALRDANVRKEDIAYINAHGTGTQYNDKFETQAIRAVFGDDADNLAVSSTKSMTGHLLGAAGAVEAIATAAAISDGFLPPTINYEVPDPECDLDYVPNIGRRAEIGAALSNSLGFGGHKAALVLTKYRGELV